jgi:hypothetical protein
MDPEGARALARRIAEGKPSAETTLAERIGGSASGLASAEEPPHTRVEDGVVYIHPGPVGHQRQVWVFVRVASDKLRRAH